jgi:probable phosphoglycerate mutase
MKRLYFVRHGQSQANVDRVFAGQSDTPLTSLGRQQAEQAGSQAKILGIDHIISSPLSRAHDTAKIIAGIIGYPVGAIELNRLLMERGFGSATGQSWDIEGDVADRFANVETMDSVAARASLAYQYIRQLPYETILVVGHGTFWQKFYLAIHPDSVVTAADEPANAEISRLL